MKAKAATGIGFALVALIAGGVLFFLAAGKELEKKPIKNCVEEQTEEEPQLADNSYCLVCHLNYEEDELTITHQQSGIGCEGCHGTSDSHSANEDGLTPPEIMYPKAKINPFCMTCHPESDVSQRDACIYVKLFAKDNTGKMTCTTCHGKHRLNTRTRIWDKETGKLISDDGVRMMYKDSPANINPRGVKKP